MQHTFQGEQGGLEFTIEGYSLHKDGSYQCVGTEEGLPVCSVSVGMKGEGLPMCGYKKGGATSVWVRKGRGYQCVGSYGMVTPADLKSASVLPQSSVHHVIQQLSLIG